MIAELIIWAAIALFFGLILFTRQTTIILILFVIGLLGWFTPYHLGLIAIALVLLFSSIFSKNKKDEVNTEH